eukprot:29346-Pelagococcus_subviridis.AAC.3
MFTHRRALAPPSSTASRYHFSASVLFTATPSRSRRSSRSRSRRGPRDNPRTRGYPAPPPWCVARSPSSHFASRRGRSRSNVRARLSLDRAPTLTRF